MDAALAELRDRVQEAVAARRAVRLVGGGTKDFLGEQLAGEPLSTTALAGVLDYEPAELYATVRAGTRLSTLETLLAAHGQHLAFDPPRFGGDPTLGGIVASGLSGPARASAGAVRDFVLGAAVLDGQAELLRFGGRVIKNVAGFDVSRLLCGSLGILGCITEVTLKVLPRPAAACTLAFEMELRRALASVLGWARRPLPVAATAWYAGQVHVRLAGGAAAVAAAAEALGGERITEETAVHFWNTVRDHQHPFLAAREPLWRVSLPAASPALDLPGTELVEWGGALRWLRTSARPEEVRERARQRGGSAVLWHGRGLAPAAESLADPLLEIHRRLKRAFDPAGIYNPGRLVAGI